MGTSNSHVFTLHILYKQIVKMSLFMMYLEKQKDKLRITRNNKIMMMFLVLVIQPICGSIKPFWQGGVIYSTFLAASSFYRIKPSRKFSQKFQPFSTRAFQFFLYLYKPSANLQIKKDK